MQHRAIADSPAQRIYNVLFAGPIAPVLEQRFLDAWQAYRPHDDERQQQTFQKALASIGDLEALELVCRRKGRLPLLSEKILLMARLAETLPDHYAAYVDVVDRPLRGYVALAWSGVRTALKYVKGLYLLRRLDGC